jgi:tetratricopeptide (TPR) repeat protein
VLLPLAIVSLVGALGIVVVRRPPPEPVQTARASSAGPVARADAGPTDEEVFAASMARLEEARRLAEETVAPDETAPASAAGPATDAKGTPAVRSELDVLRAMLLDERYVDAVEKLHALFREHSPAAVPGIELFVKNARRRASSGAAARIEPALARVQELPTSDARVRGPVAQLLGTMALASARAGQPERSRQQARAALVLDDSTPEAYLALGEYQFQASDLAGALDTWEHGLRLNPGDAALTHRLERGRAEAQRLGGLERVASEHFVVAFDGRADLPGARASLEIMEAAYRSVGALFELYPDGPISIVLYPDRSYDEEGHVSWSAAHYDGKIRLPSAGASAASPRFRGTLFHEYAHALFHRATGKRGGPAWLNEGFANVARLQAEPGPAVRCMTDAHLFPLRSLERSFARIGNHRQVRLGYLEGRHAVERIIERHGQAGVRALLAQMSTGAPFETAFERALGESYPGFAAAFDVEASR